MVEGHKCGRFKGSEDAKVQCMEGVMVGGNKCGRLERSEDAKVQCQEGVIMGGHKCGRFKGVKMQRYNVGRFKGSEDAKVQCWEAYEQIEQATITAVRENVSLWESVLVLKG